MIGSRPFPTTVVGSFPHHDGTAISRLLIDATDVPAWPQLPRRTFLEHMVPQCSAPLPSLKIDVTREKIHFELDDQLLDEIELFYSHFLNDDLDYFGLSPEYAAGFHSFLAEAGNERLQWAKGQVTGPISFGMSVTDQNLRASLYHEMLADVLVKNAAMNGRWQARKLAAVADNVVISVDEPYMASFGSAFMSISAAEVSAMLNEIFDAIHSEGALASVHCCANTDWSVLLATSVDMLSLDAFGFMENLALYPAELRDYLDRGGMIAWGIVPNNEKILSNSPSDIAQLLRTGMDSLISKAASRGVNIPSDELAERSLITPSCGLGSASIKLVEPVLEGLQVTAELLRAG